jgi:hypothetical protein
MDSILLYYETSGIAEVFPSKKYFNPSDSGIFVFYTLFEKRKINGVLRITNDNQNNAILTHTYRKKNYGWASTDQDQTFIKLISESPLFKVNSNIKIGNNIKSIETELGKPLYEKDFINIYLGANKFIAQLTFQKEQLIHINYGRYNLPDTIFKMDSISKVQYIEALLNE